MAWTRKDLLSMRELDAGEITLLIDTAASLQEIASRDIKKVPALRGKTVVNLFYESSTRTRTSFEIAGKWLSADVINFSASGSSSSKGESFIDTAKNIAAMSPDVVVVRHSSAGAADLLARTLPCSIVNAGDGAHEHPTQALLDLLTIREKKGHFEGLHVAIVGDVAHSRVARSDLHGMRKLGMTVTVAGPPTLIPPYVQELGAKVSYRLEDAIGDVDVIMMLRLQQERMHAGLIPSLREYSRYWGLTLDRLATHARPDVLIMHPGPVNRGVELSPEVADGPYSVILDQVARGVAVRMAVLLRGGRVIDPANNVDAVQDVLIEHGKITRLGRGLETPAGVEAVDAAGKIVCPGFIDMHVHLREPGEEYKETVATGTRAP